MRVLAIEPTPPTFFFLVLNLQLNRVRVLSPSTFGGAGARGVLPATARGNGQSGYGERQHNDALPAGLP